MNKAVWLYLSTGLPPKKSPDVATPATAADADVAVDAIAVAIADADAVADAVTEFKEVEELVEISLSESKTGHTIDAAHISQMWHLLQMGN